MEKYEELLTDPKSKRILNAHLSGICFGYSMCIRFFFLGVVFYIGAVLIVDYKLVPKAVFQSMYILFTSAIGAGFAMSSMPAATQGRESAKKVFKIIDEKSTCDVREQGSKI